MKKNLNKFVAMVLFFLSFTFFLTSCSQTKTEDTRTEISNVSNSEYNGVALIQSLKNKENYGTGFFIGKDTLLTNKHVVGEALQDKKKMVVRVIGDNNKHFDYEISKVMEAPEETDDLAIVKIKNNPNDKGTLSNIKRLKLASKESIKEIKKNDILHTVGYPGDKPYSTLWNSKGTITEFGDNFVAFSARIEAGSSGSPIFNEFQEVVGLSNAHDENKSNPTTFGFLLHDKLYDFVKRNT